MQVPLQTSPNSGVPAAASRRKLAGDDGWHMLLAPVREVGGLTVWERRPSVELDERPKEGRPLPSLSRATDVAAQGATPVGQTARGRSRLPRAAGVMYVEPNGRVLLVRRSGRERNYAGHWAWPGGRLDPGESPKHAAARESGEEVGHAPDLSDLMLLSTGDGRYYTYKCNVGGEFEPDLNEEHTDWEWALPNGDLPSPLHPGVAQLLHEMGKTQGAQDEVCFAFSVRSPDTTMAIDRQSVRRPDADGRMHVTATPISKATINPYWGREIPGYEELGLDPDRQYRLLRHPDELARAAPSFNNLPLLSRHVAVSALDHHPELVVGSTGTDAAYGHPYLSNSLVVWAKPAIDDVESGSKKELSCAYRYRPDMTPGVYEGQRYDGVMRDIVGNHVALVKEGRAGPDVVVGDSKEQTPMAARKPMSRVGTLAMGATIAFLAPKLAKDEKIDLMPIFRRITPKNYLSDLPKIVRAVEEAVDGKLAFDATPEGLHILLEALSKVAPKEEEIPAALAEGERDPLSADPTRMVREDAEKDPMMGGGEQPEGSPEGGGEQPEGSPEGGGEEDPMQAVKAFIKANMDPDKFAELEQMMAQLGGGGPGEGEDAGMGGGPAGFEGRPKVGGRDKRPMGGKDKRPAMDEVEKMIRAAVDGERRQAKDLREAEQFVFPYVGRLAGAFDSAEAVYRTALTMKKVDAREVKEVTALRLLLSCQQKMVDQPKVAPRVAQDSASMDDYHKLFGNLDVGFA